MILIIVLSLSVVEGNSLVMVSHRRQEGAASVFDVVHDEGQPLTLDIVVSVSLRKSMEVIIRLN